MDITVTDLPDQSRYVATSAGGTVGFLAYQRKEGVIFLNHAEVQPAQRGKGVAGELVLRAMNDARERGEKVVPVCFLGHASSKQIRCRA